MGKAAETDNLVDILVLSKYTNLLYSDSHSDPAVEASVYPLFFQVHAGHNLILAVVFSFFLRS